MEYWWIKKFFPKLKCAKQLRCILSFVIIWLMFGINELGDIR